MIEKPTKKEVEMIIIDDDDDDDDNDAILHCYSNDPALKIFKKGVSNPVHTLEALQMILGAKKNLATERPVFVEHNVIFLVDTTKMKNWQDLRNDPAFLKTKRKPPYYFQEVSECCFKSVRKEDKNSADFTCHRMVHHHKKMVIFIK